MLWRRKRTRFSKSKASAHSCLPALNPDRPPKNYKNAISREGIPSLLCHQRQKSRFFFTWTSPCLPGVDWADKILHFDGCFLTESNQANLQEFTKVVVPTIHSLSFHKLWLLRTVLNLKFGIMSVQALYLKNCRTLQSMRNSDMKLVRFSRTNNKKW